ncbi:MAG: hypothetical protein DWH81_13215 [Planctomycetota bacterium]|nr:MAG: hypothetical protein DWH81_13215 [Planctomycetota bacterium]
MTSAPDSEEAARLVYKHLHQHVYSPVYFRRLSEFGIIASSDAEDSPAFTEKDTADLYKLMRLVFSKTIPSGQAP